MDGSNWLIFRSAFPHAAFARLQRQAGGESGMRYWINEFAPSAQQGLLEQAAHALRLKLADMTTELQASIATADTKLADAATRKERERQEKNKVNAVKRCRETLRELEQAAKLYGLADGSFNFAAVRNVATALERNQYRNTDEIARLAEMAKGTTLEAAAAADEVPATILADAMEDAGNDVTAARMALGQLPATTPIPQMTLPVPTDFHGDLDMQEQQPHTFPPAEPIEVTFARLRDGSWGVRTVGAASVGDRAWAVRQRGGRQLVRLTELSRRFAGGVRLWRFEEVEEPTPAEPVATSEAQPVAEYPAKPAVTTQTLQRKGWAIRYEVNCTKAKVIRTHRGEPVDEVTMTREEARNHYAAKVAEGYTPQGDI